MGKVVLFAEKPDIGTRLAATLGGCFIGSTELKPELLTDKRMEPLIKSQRHRDGYLTCRLNGKECIVTWGFGHMAELKQAADYDARYKKWSDDLFPFVPARYEIKLKEGTGQSDLRPHFTRVKKFFTDPDTDLIINATDSDREGEVIFQYIYELTGSKKPYQRLWISSYTEEAVLDGFAKLKTAQEIAPLAAAGRARSIADWLVGANLTVLATLRFGGYKNMVSVGRVQSPTLAILVNRENEIKNFKPQPFAELIGTFATPAGDTYKGKWKKGKEDRFTDMAAAQAMLAKVRGQNGQVVVFEQTKSEERPPLLYDLTALQMDANAKFGFSAAKTLEIAQKLYENQVLTYPRTNSRYLPEDQQGEMKRILASLPASYQGWTAPLLQQGLRFDKRFFDRTKVESHHAIIPTYKTPSGLTGDEQRLYDLVAKSLVKAFMPNAVWGHTKLETEVVGERFLSQGKVLTTSGWRALEGQVQTEEDDENPVLPPVAKGDAVAGKQYELVMKQTKAPPRFTEKTLLSAMEGAGKLVEEDELREAMKDHGLGTPATRAAIIERLIQVGYVDRQGKALVPTEKGMQFIRVLPVEEIKSPSLTGDWEYKLHEVERGKLDADTFLQAITEFTLRNASAIKSSVRQEMSPAEALGKCPKCGAPVVKNNKGFGCSAWRSGCRFQIWSPVAGKKLTEANAKQLLVKGETKRIEGFMSKKTGKPFGAILVLEQDGSGRVNFKF